MNTKTNRIMGAAAVIAGLLAPLAAMAQEGEADEIRGKRIVIEQDDDGRVTIDGKVFSDGDSPVIIRVRPDDGDVEIERIGPDYVRLRDRIGGARSDHGRHVFFRGDAPGAEFFDISIDPPNLEHLAPMMERMQFEFAEPMRLRAEEHREVAELERESRELAERARRADVQEKAEIEADVRQKLAEIYEKKIEIRREQVERLEERLQDEREKLDRRLEAREQMIERRLRMLMGEEDVMDW